jgi:hypothetical protein
MTVTIKPNPILSRLYSHLGYQRVPARRSLPLPPSPSMPMELRKASTGLAASTTSRIHPGFSTHSTGTWLGMRALRADARPLVETRSSCRSRRNRTPSISTHAPVCQLRALTQVYSRLQTPDCRTRQHTDCAPTRAKHAQPLPESRKRDPASDTTPGCRMMKRADQSCRESLDTVFTADDQSVSARNHVSWSTCVEDVLWEWNEV